MLNVFLITYYIVSVVVWPNLNMLVVFTQIFFGISLNSYFIRNIVNNQKKLREVVRESDTPNPMGIYIDTKTSELVNLYYGKRIKINLQEYLLFLDTGGYIPCNPTNCWYLASKTNIRVS